MALNLQILLGRDRGKVQAIVPHTEFVVGRSSDADFCIPSDLLSRTHARILVGANAIRVNDLGSSNGTFINGARVLGEGTVLPNDVLLIGDVPMRLHGESAPVPQLLQQALPPQDPNNETFIAPVTGQLGEVPPATVLRYCAVLKKSGVLVLTSPPLEGRITFARGHISEVLVDTRKTRDPVQALTAILRWKGSFDMHPPPSEPAGTSALLGLDVVIPAVGTASRPSMIPKKL